MKSYEFVYEVTEKPKHIHSSSWCVLDTSLPKATFKFIDFLDNNNIKMFRILSINVNGKSYLSDSTYIQRVFNRALIKWAKENR